MSHLQVKSASIMGTRTPSSTVAKEEQSQVALGMQSLWVLHGTVPSSRALSTTGEG